MARKPYTHQVERAKDLLGLIHTDVYGPFKIMSRQGASYFITFTDEFSRYGYVYLLKHKHEVFETFKVFQKEVENQLGKTIKSLHSDRRGEYISQEFLDHLKDHGIIAHRTPPYTLQHNGVSERRNRTLLDMVRSMMSQTTLPKSFWDYALETAVRILNMVPTKKIEKTPYEVWHGKAPKLSYLKVWGCEALVKRDTLTKPDKLKPRSIKCIFVGYPKETMRYFFYYPPENKVLVARNAEFLENSLIDKEAKEDLEIDEPQSDTVPIRRSTRTRHAPDRMCLYIDVEEHELGDLGEPANYKAALLDLESEKWLNAMNMEMQSMKDNKVWVLVELPPNGKTVGSKWLFKKKTDMDGNVHIYKARLVAKRFTQTPGIDYEKTFSPAADIRAIRILIAKAAYYDYEIWQMDVKTAFLNGYLNKENVPYASAVGSIMYAVRCTRPDVTFAQNITSQIQQNQGDIHWTIVKNILKYLKNTKDMFLVYEGDLKRELRVSCYTDAGYLTDADDLKSQTGYVFVLNGGAVDWKSAKQSIFATSFAEAEYIAAFDASKEAVWVRKFIFRMSVVPTIEEPITMYCDNTGAIAIANESGITKGARHFCAKVHYLREVIELDDIKLEKVHTDDNLADPFTKALAFPKHSKHTRNIGILPANILNIPKLKDANLAATTNSGDCTLILTQGAFSKDLARLLWCVSFDRIGLLNVTTRKSLLAFNLTFYKLVNREASKPTCFFIKSKNSNKQAEKPAESKPRASSSSKHDPSEMKKIASEGILTCLQDAIDFLKGEFEPETKTSTLSPNDDEEGLYGKDGRVYQSMTGVDIDQPRHGDTRPVTPLGEQNNSKGNVGLNDETLKVMTPSMSSGNDSQYVFSMSSGNDSRVMSSPNHSTSDIKDAFSSNFPDYILVSPNYVPASSGKIYPSSSNNSFGLKRGHDRSSSSTPTLPQEFDIGESSRKTSLEHHEEQIREILNHLDELSLDRIENIMPSKRTSTSAASAMTQAAIRQQVANSITTTLEVQKELLELSVGLSVQNQYFPIATAPKTARIEEAYKISWVEFKKLLIMKYCPRTEVQKMEDEFYHLTVKGNDLKTYVGHMTRNSRNKGPATGSNLLPVTVTCHAYGEKGNYANKCRKTTNNNARGRAYMLRDRNAHRDLNIVTGYHQLRVKDEDIPKTAFRTRSSKGAVAAGDPKSENTSFASMVGSSESIYRPEWELRHLHNDDFLRQYNVNLARQVAMGSQLRLRFEREAKLLKKSVAQVARRDKRIFLDLQQVSTLQEQVSGEEKLKAAFDEFKQYEDNRVEQRYAEMDARLDALSIDFNEELYPHMLTAIAGRRWMIGRGLRLAVMKCGESIELRQVFADVVSAGIAKGMSEGLKHRALKNLKYPLVDQLEVLKDAPMDVIMAALHLESDTEDDAPQWVRELHPSSSQLTIPVYAKVRDPMDPWACKEEMLLADAITANVSHAEKKKKCHVVCRTHGVSSAHHARSDGVLVSVPTVIPQGLAILLADAVECV
nr:hypothetical protein [Tanacetum cinerariifolium]